jgi:hypothetical protein
LVKVNDTFVFQIFLTTIEIIFLKTRNEVWRFDVNEYGTINQRWRLTAFRGFKWGFLAFLATITIEKGLELISPPANHHGHGPSHH